MADAQEFSSGTDPNDYYNGAQPVLVIVDGNNQRGAPESLLPLPLNLKVTNGSGAALSNAPVRFSVTPGQGTFFLGGTAQGSSVTVRSDAGGTASIFFQLPAARGVLTTIAAQAGQSASVLFSENTWALGLTGDLTFLMNLGESQSETLELHNYGQNSVDFVADAWAPYYTFQDSDGVAGPVYQWEEICTTGTLLSLISETDDAFENFELPFPFPFFDQNYTSAFVSSNGFVTFGTGSDQYENERLPGVNMPGSEIAAFHADLDSSLGGAIYYRNETDRTVIEFNQVEKRDGTGAVTFEIILERTGVITVLYKSMAGGLEAATVGLQNQTQDQGVEVTYNKPYLKDGLALRFARTGKWLGTTPSDGQIGPGESLRLTASAKSDALFEGNYAGTLRVSSTQDGSSVELPASLAVNTPPTVQLSAPQPGGGFVIGETVSLEAQASDRSGPVARVEFYEGSNLIGVTETEPFQATWQITHLSPVMVTARAIDRVGATTTSRAVELRVEQDSDGDGLGDQWEMENFGDLSQTGDGDSDGDGQSNRQEFQNGSAGNDYYNGATPYPILLTRTRAANKRKVGFASFVPANPLRYYLRQIDTSSLEGGNAESPVGGVITTTIDPDTGVRSEQRSGNPFDDRFQGATRTLTTSTSSYQTEDRQEWNGGAYNDPPNEVEDRAALLKGELVLEDEYTTDLLISRVRAALPPIPAFDALFSVNDDATFADFEFGYPPGSQEQVYISHSNYQFKWYPSPNLPAQKSVIWLETFLPLDDPRTLQFEDTTPVVSVRKWEGSATETPLYTLSPDQPGRYIIRSLHGELMVDGNRDGKIEATETDRTGLEKPYRFWLNDDDDTELAYDQNGQSYPSDQEAVPAARPDYSQHEIISRRNLEDFSRLWIEVGPMWYDVLVGNVQIGLKWKTVESGGAPAINIYPSEDASGSSEYLTNEIAAGRQIAGVFNTAITDKSNKHTIKDGVFVFKSDFWSGLSGDSTKKCLLFEAASAGKGELAIVFLDRNGIELTTGSSVWLDLKNIKQMYERAKVTSTPDPIAPPSDTAYPANAPPEPTMGWISDPNNNPPDYSPTSWAETQQYIVFVHGWNMTYESSQSFAETMFKRLWQRGYKGRFARLYWPTLVGITTYNDSEYCAWKSGESLKQFMESLPSGYTKNLVSHSMGGIVSASALIKGMRIVNYALLNAAVPAACYDDSTTLYQGWGYITPHYDGDQGTRDLSYRYKLNADGGNFVNFYLPADDALRAWEFNNDTPGNAGRFLATGYKPQGYNLGSTGYYYDPAAQVGERLGINFQTVVGRFVNTAHEAMSYVAQSPTKTVGADGRTAGSIDRSVDMTNFGFGDVHSAEFNFTAQKTKPFFNRLLEEFGLPFHP